MAITITGSTINGAVIHGVPITGQVEYITSGTYSWTCPLDVTSVSVVCIGGGGSGGTGPSVGHGGGGGGLGYKNNIPVVPGTNYTVVVGSGGSPVMHTSTPPGNSGNTGGDSWFDTIATVKGSGGGGGGVAGFSAAGPGGTFLGDGGADGGVGGTASQNYSLAGGGGGAGGYAGTGGAGASPTSVPTAGLSAVTNGGGAGGGSSGVRTDAGGGGRPQPAAGGGGVGIYGKGATGAATLTPTGQLTVPGIVFGGNAGSSGTNGLGYTYSLDQYYDVNLVGGSFGGGGGGTFVMHSGAGGSGAVRIIWPGTLRQYPSTRTTDE